MACTRLFFANITNSLSLKDTSISVPIPHNEANIITWLKANIGTWLKANIVTWRKANVVTWLIANIVTWLKSNIITWLNSRSPIGYSLYIASSSCSSANLLGNGDYLGENCWLSQRRHHCMWHGTFSHECVCTHAHTIPEHLIRLHSYLCRGLASSGFTAESRVPSDTNWIAYHKSCIGTCQFGDPSETCTVGHS